MSTQSARIELRIAPESKHLIERAAELSNRSVTAFVTEVVVARALVEGFPLMSADSRLAEYAAHGLVLV